MKTIIASLLISSSVLTGCIQVLGFVAVNMVESQQQDELHARISNGLDEKMQPWVGKPIADVIAAWGEPYIIDTESREYVWREQQRNDSQVTEAAVTVDVVFTTDEQGIVTSGYGRLTDSR